MPSCLTIEMFYLENFNPKATFFMVLDVCLWLSRPPLYPNPCYSVLQGADFYELQRQSSLTLLTQATQERWAQPMRGTVKGSRAGGMRSQGISSLCPSLAEPLIGRGCVLLKIEDSNPQPPPTSPAIALPWSLFASVQEVIMALWSAPPLCFPERCTYLSKIIKLS